MSSKWYLVTSLGGNYPPTASNGLAFRTKEEAETYVAGQYTTATAAPFYPTNWYGISELELPDGYEYVTGYPAPYPTVSANTPLNVEASTDGISFTVSWTPNDPSSTEDYIVNWSIPAYAFGPDSAVDSPLSEGSVTVSGTSYEFSSVEFMTLTENPFPSWDNRQSTLAYGMPVYFTVAAANVYGQSNPSDSTPATIAYGSPAVPAAPTDFTITDTGTQDGSGREIYNITWNQPYPDGAGTPTGWIVNVPGAIAVFDTETVETSGTPSSGSYTVAVTNGDAGWVASKIGSGAVPSVFAFNEAGYSASPSTYTGPF